MQPALNPHLPHLHLQHRHLDIASDGLPRGPDAPILEAIGGAMARQRLHAIHPSSPGHQAAATGFGLAMILALEPAGARAPVLWVQTQQALAESGRPYGLGFAGLGFDPARLVVVQVKAAMEALAAAEMGLEEAGLAGVLVDLPTRLPADMLRLGKRLSLRAATRKTPCFLLHNGSEAVEAPVASRWTVASGAMCRGLAPDFTTAFDVTLTKNRFGALGHWSVVWRPSVPRQSPPVHPVATVVTPLSRDRHASVYTPAQSPTKDAARFTFALRAAPLSQPVVSNLADRSAGTAHGAQPIALRPVAA